MTTAISASEIIAQINGDSVAPKVFARMKSKLDKRDFSERSAQRLFIGLMERGLCWRGGVPSDRFPDGKMLLITKETCVKLLLGEIK